MVRQFVRSFASVAALLNNRLRKDQLAEFLSLDRTDVTELKTFKSVFIQLPVLALPNTNGHFTLDTKACDVQIGCVYVDKRQDYTAKPLSHWSRTLKDTGPEYYTTQTELLAIV